MISWCFNPWSPVLIHFIIPKCFKKCKQIWDHPGKYDFCKYETQKSSKNLANVCPWYHVFLKLWVSHFFYPPAPWVPGCEADRCCSDVPVCLISGLQVWVSMMSDVQVSDEFEAQVPASMVLESGPKSNALPSTRKVPRSGVTSEPPWKVIKFQASLQGNKSHENWSQGHPKSWEIDAGIMRNPISAKADFCNTSLAKCLVFQSQTPRFKPKNQKKKQPGIRYEKTMFFDPNVPKNLFKWIS